MLARTGDKIPFITVVLAHSIVSEIWGGRHWGK